jgi:hypothetical protein
MTSNVKNKIIGLLDYMKDVLQDGKPKRTHLCMDNFHMDITARGQDNLQLALDIVLMSHTPRYMIDSPVKGLVLFWHKPDSKDLNVVNVPPQWGNASQLASDIHEWLEEQPYGLEPPIDGDCSKGFRIYNEKWGRIDGCSDYSFIAIKPEWAIHHK